MGVTFSLHTTTASGKPCNAITLCNGSGSTNWERVRGGQKWHQEDVASVLGQEERVGFLQVEYVEKEIHRENIESLGMIRKVY